MNVATNLEIHSHEISKLIFTELNENLFRHNIKTPLLSF